LKNRLKADLELFLADNCQAWTLLADGSYEKLTPGGNDPVSAQSKFLQQMAISGQ
jgi:polyphosphate kinase